MSYLDVSEGVLAVSARIFVALFVGGCVSFIYLVSKDLQKPLENKCVDYWHGDKK